MNIYIRTQNRDLMKYLSDEESSTLLSLCKPKRVAAGESILVAGEEPQHFILLEAGELLIKKPGGEAIGKLFPGEMEAEAFYIQKGSSPYSVFAARDSELLLLSYEDLRGLTQENPELLARTEAAINDSMCLKIIRLTHRKSNA